MFLQLGKRQKVQNHYFKKVAHHENFAPANTSQIKTRDESQKIKKRTRTRTHAREGIAESTIIKERRIPKLK